MHQRSPLRSGQDTLRELVQSCLHPGRALASVAAEQRQCVDHMSWQQSVSSKSPLRLRRRSHNRTPHRGVQSHQQEILDCITGNIFRLAQPAAYKTQPSNCFHIILRASRSSREMGLCALQTEERLTAKLGSFLLLLQSKLGRLAACELGNQNSIFEVLVIDRGEAPEEPIPAGPPLSRL